MAQLERDLRARCQEYLGSAVLFDLIDLCRQVQGDFCRPISLNVLLVFREFLTERNVPVCACAVCLLNIVDDDVFVKTACYHFFHSRCLGEYVQAMEKNHQVRKDRLFRLLTS